MIAPSMPCVPCVVAQLIEPDTGKQAQRHKAHVAHRGIGHELFQVGLDDGDQRAINDGYDREADHDRGEAWPHRPAIWAGQT